MRTTKPRTISPRRRPISGDAATADQIAVQKECKIIGTTFGGDVGLGLGVGCIVYSIEASPPGEGG
jgi:hypothetical protein